MKIKDFHKLKCPLSTQCLLLKILKCLKSFMFKYKMSLTDLFYTFYVPLKSLNRFFSLISVS